MTRRTTSKHRRFSRRWLKIICATILILAGYFIYTALSQPPAAAPAATKQTASSTQPSLKDEAKEKAKEKATPLMEKFHTIMTIDETIKVIRKNPTWLPLAQIPKNTQQALLAIEDHDFYHHGAIDVTSIFRAIWTNFTAGEIVEGGSTITQQLVKNLFLSNEKSLTRKTEEAIIAFLIERRYSKDEILELYFNTTYLGSGAHGIQEASHIYFNKAPKSLSLGESCVLAALPYAPSALNPYENPKGCQKRMQLVLSTMEKYEFISPQAAKDARFAGVSLKDGTFLSFVDK